RHLRFQTRGVARAKGASRPPRRRRGSANRHAAFRAGRQTHAQGVRRARSLADGGTRASGSSVRHAAEASLTAEFPNNRRKMATKMLVNLLGSQNAAAWA